MRKLPYILTLLLLCQTAFAQQAIIPNISQKLQMSQSVVEGQVINQQAIWQGNSIVTQNTIEVFKTFKGDNTNSTIELITDGGVIGNEMHISDHKLELAMGDMGVFFIAEHNGKVYPLWDQHSLIKYDTKRGAIIDSDKKYKSVDAVYNELGKATIINDIDVKALFQNPVVSKAPAVLIECFNPNVITAGTKSIFELYGSGFEAYTPGVSTIEFTGSDNKAYNWEATDETDIIDWQDDYIQLRVPASAGSGPFKVITQSNIEFISTETVDVPYTLKTSSSDEGRINMVNEDGNGGYTFTFTENMNNHAAKTPFLNALNTLQESGGFNITIDNQTTTAYQTGNDGVNIIGFDSPNFSINSIAKTNSQYVKCGNEWELIGVDILFKREADFIPGYNWHYAASTPGITGIDFETVALHELVHAMQIGHSNHTESVVYYTVYSGQTKRELSYCHDHKAIEDINIKSEAYSPTCYFHTTYDIDETAIVPIQNETAMNAGCITNTSVCYNKRLYVKMFLEGFYDGNQSMNNNLQQNSLLPLSQPFAQTAFAYNGTEAVASNFPPGTVDWIYVELREANNPLNVAFQTACLLNTMGSLIDVDGNFGVPLPALDFGQDYLVILHHCNHLPTVTTNSVNLDLQPLINFTDNSQTTNIASSEVEPGVFALFAGDMDGNGLVNNLDFNVWKSNSAGVNIYSPADADGNGIINNLDFNAWAANRSKISNASSLLD